MQYIVYILWNEEHRKTYVGFTNDINRRLLEHNSGKYYFTRRYIPWKVIKTETFEDYSGARKREKYLKSASGRRLVLKKLVNELQL